MARAAGEFHWIGTTSTAQNISTNWLQADLTTPWGSGHYPGRDGALSAPVTGDSVFFDSAAPAYYPAGFDFSNLSNIGAFAALKILSAFTGTIGGVGTPMIVNMGATSIVDIAGDAAGAMYLNGAGTGFGIPYLNVQSLSAPSTLWLDGIVSAIAVFGASGKIDLAATITTANSLFVNGGSVTIHSGASLPDAFTQNGGTITNSAIYNGVSISGGVFIDNSISTAAVLLYGSAQFDLRNGNPSFINLYGNSRLICDNSQLARTIGVLLVYSANVSFQSSLSAGSVAVGSLRLFVPSFQMILTPGTAFAIPAS
jgi:hypothetical protein